MINLLPPDTKRQFAAGRLNSMLIRYIWITLALCLLLGALCGFTFLMLDKIKTDAQARLDDNLASVNNLKNIQDRADSFRNNLAISKSILDQQTHYTNTLLQVAALMKPGTTLNNITLDQTTYGAPMTIQVNAKSEQAAIDLKQSFLDSPIFSDVHFLSLSVASTSGSSQQANPYPVNAQMVITLKKGLQ